MARISEKELILPSLFLMDLHGGKIQTSDLIQKLRDIMQPTGEDCVILSGRNDDKFSQKVRNLKSHETFEKCGYATYEKTNTDAFFQITNSGKDFLEYNKNALYYILSNGFKYDDIKKSLSDAIEHKDRQIEEFDEDILINEGIKKQKQIVLYERSSKLREYAIKQYTTNEGLIFCKCCDFSFEKFYGPIGAKFIEIHHEKPIFQYNGDDINKTIQDAIQNLAPLCSNCHRMIHRKSKQPLTITYLKEQINAF